MHRYDVLLDAGNSYYQKELLGKVLSEAEGIHRVLLVTPLELPEYLMRDTPLLKVWQTSSGGPSCLEIKSDDGLSHRVYNHPFTLIAE